MYAFAKKLGSFRAAYDNLVEQGYDGCIVDEEDGETPEYITFRSEQNQLFDPDTCDDKGKGKIGAFSEFLLTFTL